MYSPPAKIAWLAERAGFTEVFVSGIVTRWIMATHKPIAIGAKPAGADATAKTCGLDRVR